LSGVFILGAMYLRDCPYQRFIPIYLVVGGCFGILQVFIGITHSRQTSLFLAIFDSLLSMFFFAWFIAGYTVFDYQRLSGIKGVFPRHRHRSPSPTRPNNGTAVCFHAATVTVDRSNIYLSVTALQTAWKRMQSLR